VLTPADIAHHVDKGSSPSRSWCGATNLGEALRRITGGAAMIRTKGEAGTGDVVNAVTHMRSVFGHIRRLRTLARKSCTRGEEPAGSVDLVRGSPSNGKLPVVHLQPRAHRNAGRRGICMQLGADGVFVGSGIFKSGDRGVAGEGHRRATTHYQDAEILARVSPVSVSRWSVLDGFARSEQLLETRGW